MPFARIRPFTDPGDDTCISRQCKFVPSIFSPLVSTRRRGEASTSLFIPVAQGNALVTIGRCRPRLFRCLRSTKFEGSWRRVSDSRIRGLCLSANNSFTRIRRSIGDRNNRRFVVSVHFQKECDAPSIAEGPRSTSCQKKTVPLVLYYTFFASFQFYVLLLRRFSSLSLFFFFSILSTYLIVVQTKRTYTIHA